MGKFVSTAIDPIGLGFGRAITGKKSGIMNINPGKSKQSTPELPQLPSAPDPDKIRQDEKDRIRRAQANRTKTQFTSPLGLIDENQVKNNTVLGG
jgi:hypothetical protein